jgi:hypothetical protein
MSDTNIPEAVVLPTQTFLDPDKFAVRAAGHGLIVQTQSAWIKIFRAGDGSKGPRLYVANGKTCRQINIASCEVPFHFASPAGAKAQGSVKQLMKLEGTEEEVLARFDSVIEHLLAQPPCPPVAKPEPKAKKEPKVTETVEPLPEPIKLVAGESPTVEQV